MITVNSLIGKTVVDGSGLGIAFVDGFNVTLPDNRVYLRLAGEKLLSIRGRKTEFIPVSEIDLIEENIKLFRDFTSISETVKSVNMESMETYLIKELLGKELLSLDDLKVGVVVDAHLKKDSHSLELVIEGRKLAEIRGNNREQIPFGDIVQIGDYIKLDYPFASLAERVKEKT